MYQARPTFQLDTLSLAWYCSARSTSYSSCSSSCSVSHEFFDVAYAERIGPSSSVGLVPLLPSSRLMCHLSVWFLLQRPWRTSRDWSTCTPTIWGRCYRLESLREALLLNAPPVPSHTLLKFVGQIAYWMSNQGSPQHVGNRSNVGNGSSIKRGNENVLFCLSVMLPVAGSVAMVLVRCHTCNSVVLAVIYPSCCRRRRRCYSLK